MKKFLLTSVITAILILGACGNGESENAEVEDDEVVNMMGGDTWEEPEFGMYEDQFPFDMENATDDIMSFATDDSHDVYVEDDNWAYKKVATYSGEDTDSNGLYRVNEDGYEETLRFMLLEDDVGDIFIAVVGEQINGTERPLYPYDNWEFTTDTMEQISPIGAGLSGEYAPNTKHQGMTLSELNYPEDTPTEINVTTPQVYNVDSQGDFYMDDHFIEPTEFTLTIDE